MAKGSTPTFVAAIKMLFNHLIKKSVIIYWMHWTPAQWIWCRCNSNEFLQFRSLQPREIFFGALVNFHSGCFLNPAWSQSLAKAHSSPKQRLRGSKHHPNLYAFHL